MILKDDFYFRMIKGRLAETIVQQLFLKLNYKVFYFGMEHTIPGIIGSLKDENASIENEIRSMPDFVIQNINGKAFFVEVKFRADGCFNKERLEGKEYHDNVFIILASTENFKCITVDELKKGAEITAQPKFYLYDRAEFGFKESEKKIIKDFGKYLIQFYSNLPK